MSTAYEQEVNAVVHDPVTTGQTLTPQEATSPRWQNIKDENLQLCCEGKSSALTVAKLAVKITRLTTHLHQAQFGPCDSLAWKCVPTVWNHTAVIIS